MTDSVRHNPGRLGRRVIRWIRFFSRVMLYGSASVIALFLGAFLLMQTEIVRKGAEQYLKTAVSEELGLQVEFEKLSGDLLFSVGLEKLRIAGTGGPVFEADQISATYFSPLLLKKTLLINELEVTGGRLHLIKEPDGTWNISKIGISKPETAPGETSPLDLNIIFRRIALAASEVILKDKGHPETGRHIKGIHFAAGLRIEPGSSVAADLLDARLTLDRPRFTLKQLNGELVFDGATRKLSVNRLRIQSEESDLSLKGTVDISKAEPIMDISSSVKKLSLGEIGRLTAVPELDRGTVKGRLTAKGTPANISHQLVIELDQSIVHTKGDIRIDAGGQLALDIAGGVKNFEPVLLKPFNMPEIAGVVNAEFEINGTRLADTQRTARVKLRVRDTTVSGYHVREGALALQVKQDDVTVDGLHLTTPLGRLDLQGQLFGLLAAGEKRAELTAQFENLDPAHLFRRSDLPGNLNLSLTLEADLPGFTPDPAAVSAKLAARIRPSRFMTVDIGQGNLDAVWTGGKLTIRHLKLSTGAGSVLAEGTVLPSKQDSRLTANFSIPDLEKLLPLIPVTRSKGLALQGRLEISGQVNGWWNRPEVSAEIRGAGIRFNDLSAGQLSIDGSWNGLLADYKTKATIEGKQLAFKGNRFPQLSVSVAMTPQKVTADVKGVHGDGERFLFSGSVDQWSRPIKQITVDTLQLIPRDRSAARRVGSRLINREPIRVTASEDAIIIHSLKLASDEASLSVGGRLNPEKESEVTVDLKDLDLDRVSWLWQGGERIRGMASARITVTGTGKNPVISANIRLKEGSAYTVPFSEAAVSVGYGKESAQTQLWIHQKKKPLLSAAANARLEFSLIPFAFKVPDVFDITVNTPGMDLERLPVPKPSGVDFRGILKGTVRLTVSQGKPTLDGTLHFRDGSLLLSGKPDYTVTFSELGIDFGYARKKARAKAVMRQDERKIFSATGSADLEWLLMPFAFRPFGPVDISVESRSLDLASLPVPLSLPADYRGVMDLILRISGDLDAPTVQADLTLRDGSVSMKPYGISFSEAAVRLNYDNRKARIAAVVKKENTNLLAVEGIGEVQLALFPFVLNPLDRGLDVAVETRDLMLSSLPLPKRPECEFDGRLTVLARLTGNPKAPTITGELVIEDGFFKLKTPAMSYETFSANVRLLPGKLVIDSVRIQGDKEGILGLKGEVDLAGYRPVQLNVRVTGKDFYVPFHRAVWARIQPDITLSGGPADPRLTGTLTVLESRVNLDLLAQQGPAEIQVIQRASDLSGKIQMAETEAGAPEFLKPLFADLTVDIPKRSWLKGQGLEAEIGGQVTIKKDPHRSFLLLGSLNTLRGIYNFQGKQFKFRKGSVSFLGLEDPNPALDIEAVTRIRKVEIILHITGTARQLSLTLGSEPKMEQADIVSYLVFGQPAGSLKGHQAASAENAAMSITGQIAASELKTILGEVFLLDTVTIDSGGGDVRKGSVTVGKYVAPDVFVTYKQGFSAETPNEFEATYEINKNFSVQTQVGNEKTTGVDILWGFDF